eukprot:gene32966-42660_t
MSGKRDEGKYRDDNDDEDGELFMQVMDFCTSSDFERRFEDFAREHAPTFLAAPDLREGDEQPVEFHQAYLKYLKEFEALIEGFILQRGGDLKRFYRHCKATMESDRDEQQLFGSKKFFIETMLSFSEYETFV